MTDPTPILNSAANAVNTVINDAVSAAEKIAETSIEAEIESSVPFFALPVIRNLEEFTIEELIGYIGKKLSIGLQQVGTFLVIDTQVSNEKAGISQALANLMLAEKSGDQNAIQTAIAAYQKSQSSLINSDGYAPPVA